MTKAKAPPYNKTEAVVNENVNHKYIPALDGLRGIAILMVIAFHFFDQTSFVDLGWAGVDLFFVLSGFLITKRLMENKDQPNRYTLFYRNRALRILPLYFLVLIVFYLFVYYVVSPPNFHRFDGYTNNKTAFFLFLQNWVFIFDGVPKEPHLNHFWSLAVEEQFYLVWPFFLYNFYSSIHFKKILLATIVGVFLLRNGLHFFTTWDIFPNTFCRMDTLLTGALTWFLLQTPLPPKKVMWFGIFTLLVLVAGYTMFQGMRPLMPFSITIGLTAFAALFASVIYMMVIKPDSLISRIFKNSFLRFTGKISYGMYIFHYPVLVIAGPKISSILQPWHVPIGFTRGLICLLITYVISIFSYYFYESYFLKRKSTIAA